VPVGPGVAGPVVDDAGGRWCWCPESLRSCVTPADIEAEEEIGGDGLVDVGTETEKRRQLVLMVVADIEC
jgi:hypothetical protein